VRPYRYVFVFDQLRPAVFLVEGAKSVRWSDWYRAAISPGRGSPRRAQANRVEKEAGDQTSKPPLNNPNARHWEDLVEEFDFTPQETQEIREGADRMIAEVRARLPAEVQAAEREPGVGREGRGIS
jgi:hypothetical protein